MTIALEETSGKDIGSAEHTRSIPRKRSAATVLFTDGAGRVLLCEPSYKQVWEAPGGAVEANESPRDGAAREVREELGLVVEPGRLVAVDYVPPLEGRTEGLIFVYDGGHLTGEQAAAIRLAEGELKSWAWCTVEQVHERMRPVVARRIEVALGAITDGGVVELENGYPVGSTISAMSVTPYLESPESSTYAGCTRRVSLVSGRPDTPSSEPLRVIAPRGE